MNWTNLILGIFFLFFGLYGYESISGKENEKTYSRVKIIYSSYGLILAGILLIIWTLFFE